MLKSLNRRVLFSMSVSHSNPIAQVLINALLGQVPIRRFHISGKPTNQELGR
jgi:hypothetical protein